MEKENTTLLIFKREIPKMKKRGFTVSQINSAQFRINDCLDIYPVQRIYHDIRKNTRGKINSKSFRSFVNLFFNIT